MNIKFKIFFFTTLLCTFLSFGQDKEYSGVYIVENEFDSGAKMRYELALNRDGTFTFIFYQDQIFFQDTKKGVGTWTNELDDIFLTTTEEDISEEFTLNFSNTKAYVDGKRITIFETEIDDFLDIVLER